MMDIYGEIQRELVAEYRSKHPEAAAYSDEEIAQIEPVSAVEVNLYISDKIGELQKEIDFNLQKINDPRTHYQEITELRSENALLYGMVDTLVREKIRLLRGMGEELDEPRGR